MRLLTKGNILPKAVPYRTLDGEPVVRLRCGQLWYELLPGEAADLGRQLIAAAAERVTAVRVGGCASALRPPGHGPTC